MTHLLTYISGHGFGHVAQTAPVLNALRRRWPDLRLTIVSSAPQAHLQSRIHSAFSHVSEARDFGMVMASALDVRVEDSMQQYRDFHRHWADRVVAEARFIEKQNPQLVFSNVAYLPLAAAQSVGIPALAMCSLNWADIFHHYCSGEPDASEIHAEMLSAYVAADFLRVTPGMAMTNLPRVHPISPIAHLGKSRRNEIHAKLGLGANEKLVMVTMGGIASRLPMENWPRIPGVRWLVQGDWHVRHPDCFVLESLGMDFTDVLISCDALLCKPGYGTFAEAACNGVPILYAARPDWPEEPCLVEWMQQHGRCLEAERRLLQSGDMGDLLSQLWTLPTPPLVAPQGAEEAAEYIAARLMG